MPAKTFQPGWLTILLFSSFQPCPFGILNAPANDLVSVLILEEVDVGRRLTAAMAVGSRAFIAGPDDGRSCGLDSWAVGRGGDCASSSSSESPVESDLERRRVPFLETRSKNEGRALRVYLRPSIHYLARIV